MSLPPDYHLHTRHCGHASGSVDEMIRMAIQKGFLEIGFAEHFPYPDGFEIDVPDCVVPSDLWPQYLFDVHDAQKKFGDQIQIRLGAEIDYLPGYESDTASRLSRQDYDVVFGSVHILDGIVIDYDLDYLNKRIDALGGIAGLWQKYWDNLESLIQAGLCDVIAHLDLPKKLGIGFPDTADWERIADLLDQIHARNLTIEINTGGIDRAVRREVYPTEKILRMAFEKGIDVLIGSDSHHPDQIGRYFNETLARLVEMGWRYVTVFQNRKKSYQSIEKYL
ncbi:histidinol-phosphatase HisJ [bacterium]|nr:MAG: histidinol-phosphatase HisJ [bacterium]